MEELLYVAQFSVGAMLCSERDDKRHLPYMSEKTQEHAGSKPARTPKPVRIFQSVAHDLPTATVNTSPPECPSCSLHGLSDLDPHKDFGLLFIVLIEFGCLSRSYWLK